MRWLRLGGLLLVVGGSTGGTLAGQSDSVSSVRLELNLAATRVRVFRHDSVVARFPVAIGRPTYPTPTGAYSIGVIEWNPWWIPPASDWARGEAPRPPGPTNPMGRVKLNFKPLYFLHGTPEEGSIGTAASHGCVRLLNRDAMILAKLVMAAGLPSIDSTELMGLERDTVTTSAWLLERPVPITITSRQVEIESDSVFGYPDPYGAATMSLVAQVVAALAARPDQPQVDSAAVAGFAARAKRQPTVAAVRDLVRPTW